MPSYNEIDGVPSHANTWLLQDVLRNEWGFEGFLVSDYYAVTELHEREEAIGHSLANNKSEAAALVVAAGVTMELPEPGCYTDLVHFVRQGVVSVSSIDTLVGPLLKYRFRLGLFEDPYVNSELIQNAHRLEQERALALRAARETITLLKNDNAVLALQVKKNGTIAVIVPNAITYIHTHVPASLECWYVGQETGPSVADILFGDCTPGGELPIPIPRSVGHIPCYYNYKPSARWGYLFCRSRIYTKSGSSNQWSLPSWWETLPGIRIWQQSP